MTSLSLETLRSTPFTKPLRKKTLSSWLFTSSTASLMAALSGTLSMYRIW